MEEAELSLSVAESLYNQAKKSNLSLWAHVIKNCYDAVEQAISSAIASREKPIPIRHPEKINLFLFLFSPANEIKTNILFLLGKRSSAQYVDIKNNKISVPHEIFSEEDAKASLDKSRFLVGEIKKLIEK